MVLQHLRAPERPLARSREGKHITALEPTCATTEIGRHRAVSTQDNYIQRVQEDEARETRTRRSTCRRAKRETKLIAALDHETPQQAKKHGEESNGGPAKEGGPSANRNKQTDSERCVTKQQGKM